MLTILYSYGKQGLEASHWNRDIASASTDRFRFIPFNHRDLLGGRIYGNASDLDRDFRQAKPKLWKLYEKVRRVIAQQSVDCLFVNNDNVYHPDFLLSLKTYRCYYTTDDPGATYSRTIPYVHAFHHLFHCAIPYSEGKTLRQKLFECGASVVDFLPLGVFDFEFDPSRDESTILASPRDIDIVYVGNPFFANKLDAYLKMCRAFRSRLKIYGFWKPKHNVYLSFKLRRPIWVRPVSFSDRVRLCQRAKIGFNVHWDNYGLGNQRLYLLPANGVMQICDCPDYLNDIFDVGREVVPAMHFDEMVEKAKYYLAHDTERERIALGGYRRVMKEYRMRELLHLTGELILHRLNASSQSFN